MNNYKIKCLLSIAVLTALISAPARAAVTSAEAAKLGSELTPLGAERAGNAEGSIPEWTGGTKAYQRGINPAA